MYYVKSESLGCHDRRLSFRLFSKIRTHSNGFMYLHIKDRQPRSQDKRKNNETEQDRNSRLKQLISNSLKKI